MTPSTHDTYTCSIYGLVTLRGGSIAAGELVADILPSDSEIYYFGGMLGEIYGTEWLFVAKDELLPIWAVRGIDIVACQWTVCTLDRREGIAGSWEVTAKLHFREAEMRILKSAIADFHRSIAGIQ